LRKLIWPALTLLKICQEQILARFSALRSNKNQGWFLSESTSIIREVYPNPFTNEITISNLSKSNEDIEIYNLLGQNLTHLIAISYFNGGAKIETSKLPKGVYVLRTKSFSKKVVK